MSTSFFKLQGTGNDFIFLFGDQKPLELTPARIAELCARQTGVGADGLVVIHREAAASSHYRWDFYNADGGEAEMCGNAARCATRLLTTLTSDKTIKLKTRAGVFTGTVSPDGDIEVVFDLPPGGHSEFKAIAGSRFPVGYLTNTGVPHCVIPTSNPWGLRNEARALAPFIFDPRFSKSGANLTFVDWSEDGVFETVTLERGVNDFTLACGTGVIAAARVFADLHQQGGWRKLKTPGGDLQVHYVPGQSQVHLKGPATVVFKGEL